MQICHSELHASWGFLPPALRTLPISGFVILRLYGDNGKETGNYCNRLYRDYRVYLYRGFDSVYPQP